ncbi:helix-turn-helix transcriptional regulator [bacterium]|nr:helix-turn-helix transcriptional regulator [bacterium]
MSINYRIKELREILGLSQAKFAKNISISNGYIAEIELGNRKINDRIIKLICAVYCVNESWLKTGEGNIFISSFQDQETEHAMRIFKRLSPKFQQYVLNQIENLLELQNALLNDGK